MRSLNRSLQPTPRTARFGRDGPGVTREVGADMKQFGSKRVLVVTDPNLADSESVMITMQALQEEGIDVDLYDQVRVEPTDESFKQA